MLIDEKARLFGKINIIDFLVLVFILCLIPIGYFGYKIMTKPTPTPTPTSIPTITLDKAEYEKKQVEYKQKQQVLIVKIAECEAEIFAYEIKIDNLLKEHKRLRKHFE